MCLRHDTDRPHVKFFRLGKKEDRCREVKRNTSTASRDVAGHGDAHKACPGEDECHIAVNT